MREFLSLLDGAMPYVVLLPTGKLNPDIPDECRELIAYVHGISLDADLIAAKVEAILDEPVDALHGSGLGSVLMDSVAAPADPDRFAGEDE